ncbi:hypothetical protein Pvag_pPag30090 (plasmid) [Pantoea vagans C9-1]|nr:hypothetical protein Pvag_pPag30090 [Pantoea vagans C9-1]
MMAIQCGPHPYAFCFHHFCCLKRFIYTDYYSGHLLRMPRRRQHFHFSE